MPRLKYQVGRNAVRTRTAKPQCFFTHYILAFLSIIIWLLGTAVIGYVSWVLCTSVSVTKFVAGNLICTYVLIGIGLSLFLTGFLGCIGATCLIGFIIRLYLLVSVLCLATEIGGIIALQVKQVRADKIIQKTWEEMNEGTKNLIQKHFNCCGFDGPKELAYRTEIIDISCYKPNLFLTASTLATEKIDFIKNNQTLSELKEEGCGVKLFQWFDDNRSQWVSVLGGIGGIQLLCIIIAAYVITQMNNNKRIRVGEELEEHSRAYTS